MVSLVEFRLLRWFQLKSLLADKGAPQGSMFPTEHYSVHCYADDNILNASASANQAFSRFQSAFDDL